MKATLSSRMRRIAIAVIALGLALGAALAAVAAFGYLSRAEAKAALDPAALDDFSWHGAISAGKTVQVRGINGSIRAEWTSGAEAGVTARKTAKRSDPGEVRIEVTPYEGGVLVCAIYPAPRGKPANICEPGHSHSETRNNDVTVDFRVKLPRGVRLEAETVNGSIDADGLQSDVEANVVNGSVAVSTTGTATAHAVNGSIHASMGRLAGDLEFETVNGEIVLTLPEAVNADFSAETVNGEVTSDFPVTVTGRLTRHKLHGTLGDGGPGLKLATVNGDIELRVARYRLARRS